MPDYSKIDINNEFHRKYIIEQFIFPGDIIYPFDIELKQKMYELKEEYSMGFLTNNEIYNQILVLLKQSLDDYSVEKNIDRIVDLNKN